MTPDIRRFLSLSAAGSVLVAVFIGFAVTFTGWLGVQSGIEAAIAGGFRSIGLGPRERVGVADAVFPSLAGVHLADLLSALEPQSSAS